MGLFSFLKKNEKAVETKVDSLDKLDENGELPFGWIAHNQDFANDLSSKMDHFRSMYKEAKTTPERKSALKSLLQFFKDADSHSAKLGECHHRYFEMMYLDNSSYLNELEDELADIEANYDEYIQKDKKQAFLEENVLPTLEHDVLEAIRSNEGILQKDLYKMFDKDVKNNISEMLYFMAKEGKITREKSGSSYQLNIQ